MIQQPSPRHRFPIRLHITTSFLLLLAMVGGTMVSLAYQRTAAILAASSTELVRRAAHESALALEGILAPVRTGVRMLAVDGRLSNEGLEAHFEALPTYIEALKATPAVDAFYFGDKAGNHFLVRRLLDDSDQALFKAPPTANFVAQVIDRRTLPFRSEYVFYNTDLAELGRVAAPKALEFDPRQRPWYQMASTARGLVLTPPYTYFTSGKIGLSIASRAEQGANIFGADLRLDTLSQLLVHKRMTPGSHLFLLDSKHRLLAGDSAKEDPTRQTLLARLTQMATEPDDTVALERQVINGTTWFLETLLLPMAGDRETYLGVAIPEAEMLAEAHRLRSQLIWMMLILLLLSVSITFWLGQRIARPLSQLVRDTETIRQFDLDGPIRVQSIILEVDELAQTLRHTKTTLARFLDIVARLTNEADFNRLMPELLRATGETVNADGGLLYMLDAEQAPRLVAGLWDNDALDLRDGDDGDDSDAFSCRAALAQSQTLTFEASTSDCVRFGLPAVHAVSIPLFNRNRRAIGILVLLGRKTMDPTRLRFVQALSGFAAVALETRELIAMQKALFESFIRVMAGAIDAKSPYTGGHCARVPEAVKLLAMAACDESEGPYADFSMSAEDWEALHIASWLHDCGKVTTPEYVVDKATKLETLYDRIHEVRMRFEVLKRDAEIDHLRAIAAGADPLSAQAERDAALAALDGDFAFVAECNLGGEFMAPDKMARLRRIAERKWQRTLDDRLGIANEDRRRRGDATPAGLPVEEQLLSDRPEHRFERVAGDKYGPGNPWGFSMQIPELLYDRGELKNLMIARGTLGDEERFKINEHIIQTIIMLTTLPFPRHLANVPEIAGGHHERMDGKGYPKCLTAEQMSPLARMMAIADVFEALTACDRPYKSAKTVSQSLAIMRRMAEEGHIDPELLRIFLASGACARYVERFLAPAQRDVTDFTTSVS